MRTKSLLILLLACGLGQAPTALAQTGRLAHLSHSGSMATMAATERADNFGLPPDQYKYERITRLNDSMMLVEGQKRDYAGRHPWQPFKWQQQYHWARNPEAREQTPAYLRQQYAGARLIGFDSTTISQPSRKKSILELGLPALPGWGPGAGLLLLAGAGWLLVSRPRPALKVVA